MIVFNQTMNEHTHEQRTQVGRIRARRLTNPEAQLEPNEQFSQPIPKTLIQWSSTTTVAFNPPKTIEHLIAEGICGQDTNAKINVGSHILGTSAGPARNSILQSYSHLYTRTVDSKPPHTTLSQINRLIWKHRDGDKPERSGRAVFEKATFSKIKS